MGKKYGLDTKSEGWAEEKRPGMRDKASGDTATSTAEDTHTHTAFWPQPRASSPAAYWIPYLSITVFPAKENSAGSNYFSEPVNFILGG